jgi:hypothetical protein
MGNSSSRLDRFAGTYEKSFARIEKDVERLKVRVLLATFASCSERKTVLA